MRTYSKPALTVEQQIALLESRGLSIPDHARAYGISQTSVIIG